MGTRKGVDQQKDIMLHRIGFRNVISEIGDNRIPDREDVPSDPLRLKSGVKLYPADPRWGDGYVQHVKQFREIFLK